MSKHYNVSPYRICIYERLGFDPEHTCIESGIGVIFENRPGLVFPLAIPDDPQYIGLTAYHLAARPREYRVRVRGGYASPLDICHSDLAFRALKHLGELIDNGIADVPTPACGGVRYDD